MALVITPSCNMAGFLWVLSHLQNYPYQCVIYDNAIYLFISMKLNIQLHENRILSFYWHNIQQFTIQTC